MGDVGDDRIEAAVELTGQEEIEPVAIILREDRLQADDRCVGMLALIGKLCGDIGRHLFEVAPVRFQRFANILQCRRATGGRDIAGADLVRNRPTGLIARGQCLKLAHRRDARINEP